VRILISGYHNPHYVTVTEYIEGAVRSLGHDVIPFNDRDHIFPGRLRTKIHLLQKLSVRAINRGLLKLAARTQPDVVLITGGHRITPRALLRLSRQKAKTVLWTTDAPRPADMMFTTASYYHAIFCQGTEYVDRFHRLDIQEPRWLPMACDPETHRRVDLPEGEKGRFGSDIAFVGSYYPHRAESLQQVSAFKPGIWGPGWDVLPQDSPLRPFLRGAHTTPETWIRIYSASKMVLSIHYRDPQAGFPVHQASPRVFEAMACGAFVLTDRQKDVVTLFRDGVHLVTFDDDRDLRNKVDHFLQHPEERERIAAAGMHEVLSRHTYGHRVRELFAHIERLHPRSENTYVRSSAAIA
jgi:spore maturation protein CgeB